MKLDFAAIDREHERQADFATAAFNKLGLTTQKARFERLRRVHRVIVSWDEAKRGLTTAALVDKLRDGQPRIAVLPAPGGQGIEVSFQMNDEGDEKALVRRMQEDFQLMFELDSQLLKRLRVKPGKKISLSRDYSPTFDAGLAHDAAEAALGESITTLSDLQDKLFAQNTYSVLLIFQAMDAAGKDSTIKHVMSGVNPQGCQVFSFKVPSAEEVDHDYLWRAARALPERGRIGIFNRSYYEEVLVVRVHPDLLNRQQLPPSTLSGKVWKNRYRDINNFEQHLVENGTVVLKFFLNVSKEEQKKRFLARLEEPEKNWKFAAPDVDERGHWDEYMAAYQECLRATSTEWAPWYVIPADDKDFMRVAVAGVICRTLDKLKLHYPEVPADKRQSLLEAKARLEAE